MIDFKPSFRLLGVKVVIKTKISRRTCLTVFVAGFAAEPALIGKDNNTMKEMLESSQNEKKSVTLYVKGQSFGGLVIKVAGEFVELRNREFNQILIRIDAIDAAAMS